MKNSESLQGLKPTEFARHTPGLKPRPPEKLCCEFLTRDTGGLGFKRGACPFTLTREGVARHLRLGNDPDKERHADAGNRNHDAYKSRKKNRV